MFLVFCQYDVDFKLCQFGWKSYCFQFVQIDEYEFFVEGKIFQQQLIIVKIVVIFRLEVVIFVKFQCVEIFVQWFFVYFFGYVQLYLGYIEGKGFVYGVGQWCIGVVVQWDMIEIDLVLVCQLVVGKVQCDY